MKFLCILFFFNLSINSGLKSQNYLDTVTIIDGRIDTIFLHLNGPKNSIHIADFTTIISQTIPSKDRIVLIHSYYFYRGGSYLNFEASVFQKSDNSNLFVRTIYIDTFFKTSRKLDSKNIVDQKLLMFNILQRASKVSDSIQYSLNDLYNFDSISISKLPLYTRESLIDGVYFSYNSFANQTPDINDFHFSMDHNLEFKLKAKIENKMKKLNSKQVYAVVKNGDAFAGANMFGFNYIHRDGKILNFKAQLLSPTNLSKKTPFISELQNSLNQFKPYWLQTIERNNGNYDSYAVYRAFINYKTGNFNIYEMISGD